MAMTAQVKAELASTKVTKSCCRKSEVSSMLRFAGGLHIVSGRIVVEDLNSSNGTRVNGKRVRLAVLVDGDEIAIGDVTLRFLAVALIFAVLLALHAPWRPRFTRREWGIVAVAGVLSVPVCQLAIVEGQRYLSPPIASLVVTFSPAIAAVLAARSEHLSRRQIAGFALALTGVAVIVVLGAGSGAELAASDPLKAAGLQYLKQYEGAYGAGSRNAFAAYAWDAGILVQSALPAALKATKPGTPAFRDALRDAIEAGKDVKGTHAVYNMSATDHYGVDKRARVLVKVENGEWKLVR